MNQKIRRGLSSFIVLISTAGCLLASGPSDRRAIGKIAKVSAGKTLAEVGDKVVIRFKKRHAAKVGDKLEIYKVRDDLMAEGQAADETAVREEILGIAEVEKLISGGKAAASVLSLSGDIEAGLLVRRIQEKP